MATREPLAADFLASDGHQASANQRSRERLGDTIAGQLAQTIATGRFEAGHLLPSERELAERFGVSTRVIREALRTLAEQGIVRTSQGRRAEVSDWHPTGISRYLKYVGLLSDDPIAQLLEVRFAIEPSVAALAAERATDGDLAHMRSAVEDMAKAGDDITAWVDADTGFHAAIVRATGNQFFVMIVDALADSLREERIAGVQGRRRQGRGATPSLDEHRSILAALEARDPALSRSRMQQHLEDSLTYFWNVGQRRPSKKGSQKN